jgi:hypothetical protein
LIYLQELFARLSAAEQAAATLASPGKQGIRLAALMGQLGSAETVLLAAALKA